MQIFFFFLIQVHHWFKRQLVTIQQLRADLRKYFTPIFIKVCILVTCTIHIRGTAPNVVKNTPFFGNNFVCIALIPVKLQSNELKSLFFCLTSISCGKFPFKARNQPVIQVMIIYLELFSEYIFVVNQFIMFSREIHKTAGK